MMVEDLARDLVAPSFVADLGRAREALDFARERHHGQHRVSDGAPYIVHPLEVAALLHHTGHAEPLVAAGLLHDLVEDTATTLDEVHDRFGDEIAATVGALTEDPSIAGYHPRKEALRRAVAAGGASACAVYAADKVAKVRELRSEVAHGATDLYGPKLTHYEHSLAMLEAHRPRHPLVEQLRFELELLEALPPR